MSETKEVKLKFCPSCGKVEIPLINKKCDNCKLRYSNIRRYKAIISRCKFRVDHLKDDIEMLEKDTPSENRDARLQKTKDHISQFEEKIKIYQNLISEEEDMNNEPSVEYKPEEICARFIDLFKKMNSMEQLILYKKTFPNQLTRPKSKKSE